MICRRLLNDLLMHDWHWYSISGTWHACIWCGIHRRSDSPTVPMGTNTSRQITLMFHDGHATPGRGQYDTSTELGSGEPRPCAVGIR